VNELSEYLVPRHFHLFLEKILGSKLQKNSGTFRVGHGQSGSSLM
jgi:hypothetical protein